MQISERLSLLHQRDIDESYTPDKAGILASKLTMPTTEAGYQKANQQCPFGEYVYRVVTGPNFDREVTERAVFVARLMMLDVDLHDDLRPGLTDRSNDVNTHVEELAHALEHITLANLIKQRSFQMPPRSMVLGGTSRLLLANEHDRQVIFFYLRKGLTTPQEEMTGIQKTIKIINGVEEVFKTLPKPNSLVT